MYCDLFFTYLNFFSLKSGWWGFCCRLELKTAELTDSCCWRTGVHTYTKLLFCYWVGVGCPRARKPVKRARAPLLLLPSLLDSGGARRGRDSPLSTVII